MYKIELLLDDLIQLLKVVNETLCLHHLHKYSKMLCNSLPGSQVPEQQKHNRGSHDHGFKDRAWTDVLTERPETLPISSLCG